MRAGTPATSIRAIDVCQLKPCASAGCGKTVVGADGTMEVTPDGMRVPGKQKFRAAKFDSFGDHRIAMAFAVAALRADGESVIENAEAASVSFPEFWGILEKASAL